MEKGIVRSVAVASFLSFFQFVFGYIYTLFHQFKNIGWGGNITFKNIKGYGLYAILLFTILIIIILADYRLDQYASKTFRYSLKMTFILTVYPLVGCMLGIIHLFYERRKTGKWQINMGKVFVLALPAFLLAYYPFIIYFGPLSFLTIPSAYFNQAMISVSSAMYIFQIIFGYSIMTSFYKDENTPSSFL